MYALWERLRGSGENRGGIPVIAMLTQIVGLIRVGMPVVSCICRCIRKLLRVIQRVSILHSMKSYHQRNCKLRSNVYTVVDEVVTVLQRQPGGYMFWASLPQHGTHNSRKVRKVIADIVLDKLFSDDFVCILLKTALTDKGLPKQPLYTWLVDNIYGGNVQQLYGDWLKIGKGDSAATEQR